MADPTNISKVTATNIGTTFPFTITQDANIAGVTQDLWYTLTPIVSGLYGAYGLGTNGGYAPHTNADDAADTFPVLGAPNAPIQYYLVAGVPFWFQVQNVGGNHVSASLTFSVLLSPDLGIRAGDLFVQDDIDGFPGIAIDPTDGTPTHAVFPFPGGEAGDSIPTGAVLVEDQTLRTVNLYTGSLTLVTSIADHAIDTDTHICRSGDRTAFYFASHTASTTVTVNKVNAMSGAILQTWTLTSTQGVSAIAVSPDDMTLYLSGKGGTTTSAINAYNLAGSAFLADFAATVTGYNFRVSNLLCLTNGHVVASYRNNGSNPLLVKVYDAAGTVLVSQTYGTGLFGHHVGYAVNDPTSFWLWINLASNTRNVFHNVKASDLTDVAPTPFTVDTFEEGVNNALSPVNRFGNSGSCPLFPLYTSVVPTQTFTIRRQRRFLLPSSDDNTNMTIPTLELLMRTGIGLKPTTYGDGDLPLGADPEVRFRLSKDGGATWGPERVVSAGKRGRFFDRVRLVQAVGNYRNGVIEVTVDAPVDFQFLSAMGNVTPGTS